MSNSGEFLSFREETTSISFTELEDRIPLNAIGDGATFSANLYAPGTNLFDDEPDEVLGTKTGRFGIVAQLGNGEFIGTTGMKLKFFKYLWWGCLERTIARHDLIKAVLSTNLIISF